VWTKQERGKKKKKKHITLIYEKVGKAKNGAGHKKNRKATGVQSIKVLVGVGFFRTDNFLTEKWETD